MKQVWGRPAVGFGAFLDDLILLNILRHVKKPHGRGELHVKHVLLERYKVSIRDRSIFTGRVLSSSNELLYCFRHFFNHYRTVCQRSHAILTSHPSYMFGYGPKCSHSALRLAFQFESEREKET